MLAASTTRSAGPVKLAMEHAFSPYTSNGGTTVCIAGEDYCLAAGDTRQSEGYSINTRYNPKVFPLSNGTVLASTGMAADTRTLVKVLEQRLEWYRHQHEKQMSPSALAQMLSTILYGKRFFPYYTFNAVAGVDADGRGAIYTYDPVGNMERVGWDASGSAGNLIQPFLDNQVGYKHQPTHIQGFLPLEAALRLVKDSFTSATERDIHTGDFLEIYIIKADGVVKELYDLKKD
ncbi:hypothetical protein SeMB42_g04658 [Synchytrium endobioticum]|uniref:Proteasome subunit beta n=1 Tax=Synchytrium endobioticum TaxID=286115 RepID=A0A507CWQ4_9FUNG|nr:hypothetical protein SeLEV6574_g06690 [Synchytrium endobioticum]TPX43637.1 hypothetical protein SeMB42_g04658 [Synchytrium endobioticum]